MANQMSMIKEKGREDLWTMPFELFALASSMMSVFSSSRAFMYVHAFSFILARRGAFADDAIKTRTREHTGNVIINKRDVARLVLEAFYNE